MSTKAITAPDSCKIYTPRELAEAMVAAITEDNLRARWLEPCAGKGAFLKAMCSLGVSAKDITALDLDPKIEEADRLAHTLRPMDFFAWASETAERFDRIVANPPYVRVNKYHPKIRPAAARLSSVLDFGFSAESNAWLLFLTGALHLLADGGSLAFVLPAAWDYADYAESARTSIPFLFREFYIHRSKRPLFPSVQDGVVVIVGRGFNRPHVRCERLEHDSSISLIHSLLGQTSGVHVKSISGHIPDLEVLGNWCKIRIGAVTGDSNYFLLTETERRAARLPKGACLPVVSKARHVVTPSITAKEWRRLLNQEQRVWLFRPNTRTLGNQNVQAYLRRDVKHGGCNRSRFKIKTRDPWYLTPLPPRAHAFISGMSNLGPLLCINRSRNLTATNTLYVVEFINAPTLESRAAVGLSLLSSECRRQMLPRRYADGLAKWEPGDLEALLIPKPRIQPGALAVYNRAVAVLLTGNIDAGCRIADEWHSGDRTRSLESS